LDQIASFIQGHDHFAVSTHVTPDGDALGSALATYWMLKRLGKQAVVVMHDAVPRNLDFLPGCEHVIRPHELDEEQYEQVILVDCGSSKRVGKTLHNQFKGRFTINIDHHCDNPRFGSLHYVRELASTTMVLDELREAIGLPLDQEVATCLYTGLVTDTGSFCNASVDETVLSAATRWVHAGVDPHFVAQNAFERQSWNEVQLQAYALSSMQREQGIIWCALPYDVFERFHLTPHDTDRLVSQLRAIEGGEVAVLFKEIDHDLVKVSFRAKGELSVNAIAQHFGGGGHVRAAGCLLEGPMNTVVQSVLDQVRLRLTPLLQR